MFVAAAAVAIWFLRGSPNPYITAIGVVCTLVGGFPIFHEAYENITQRRMTMELSMTIAIVAALAIREIFTALIITLFVLAAEILEGLTVGRGRQAIQRLIDLLPSNAAVRRQGEWKDVPILEIAVGDDVLARPGVRIAVDGKVVGGHSFVDQAPITGESMPVEKSAVPLFTLARSISRERLRFAWNASVAIRRLARSSRQLNGRRSRAPLSKESRTGFRAIWCTSRWLPPQSPS